MINYIIDLDDWHTTTVMYCYQIEFKHHFSIPLFRMQWSMPYMK